MHFADGFAPTRAQRGPSARHWEDSPGYSVIASEIHTPDIAMTRQGTLPLGEKKPEGLGRCPRPPNGHFSRSTKGICSWRINTRAARDQGGVIFVGDKRFSCH